MPQHLLNCPQISSCLDHVGGKRVPESMRAYIFSYSCSGSEVFDYYEDHCPCKLSPATVEKQDILIMDNGKRVPVLFINIHLLQCFPAHRYKSLLISFSCYNNKFFAIVYICQTQIYKLRYSQTASVQCF